MVPSNPLACPQDSSGATISYTWDYRNRLTDVVYRDSQGNVTKSVHYTYDVHDQRIGKQVTVGSSVTTERYVYSNGQMALVFNGNGQVQERYVYGPNTDQVLAVERGATGPAQWLLGDDQSSA